MKPNLLIFRLLRIIGPIVLIYFAFAYHILLGFLAVIVFLFYILIDLRAFIYAHMGNIKYVDGHREEALKMLKLAAETKNCKPKYIIAYAFVLLKTGHIDKAEEVLKELEKRYMTREEKMKHKLNTAIVLWKKGKEQEGFELLKDVYSEFKETVTYGSLGYIYVLRGELEEALAFNLEAYEHNDTNAVILDNLGQTYLLLGEYDKALEIYQKLMKLEPAPKFPEAYYNYGLVLLHLDQKEEALEQFKKSLEHEESLVTNLSHKDIKNKISELEARKV